MAFHVVALVHGSGGEPKAVREWGNCARGKRHVFFAYESDEAALGAGDAMLEHSDDTAGVADLYAVVSQEMWRRLMLEVVKAGLTAATFEHAERVREELADVSDKVHGDHWHSISGDVSETANQDWVRYRLLNALFDLTLPQNVRSELVECLVRAAPVVRDGGAPVFAVEVGSECFFVTSYFPTPIRQTLFMGIPCSVQSAGGLTYDVMVLTEEPPKLSLIV